MPEAKFEEQVARAVKVAVAATEGDAAVVREARKAQQDAKRDRRAERERELAAKIVALPDKLYGVIVSDPEWKDEVWSEETGMDRAAANHYPVSPEDVIRSRPVGKLAAKDCVLWMWTTNQHLRIALGVMEAWGFEYKSNYVWVKDGISTGRWNRSRHEILLIGTRGNPVCPAPGTQWDSAIMSPRLAHSEKPKCFLEMIEAYFPNTPKIELNCRGTAASRLGCVGQRSRGGGRMRRVLPQRRAAETFDLRFWNQQFTVTVGFYPDGTPGEVFIDGGKTGQDIQSTPATPPWC